MITAKYADKGIKNYLSLILLFIPATAFVALLAIYYDHPRLETTGIFPFLPWQFYIVAVAGLIATYGGIADWRYHRGTLSMRIPQKEREVEAKALGIGGTFMFVLMWLATLSDKPHWYLIPIVIVLIYNVVMISYDEFVFHRKRCRPEETRLHRMLVFGNGLAWLSWFSFIYT